MGKKGIDTLVKKGNDKFLVSVQAKGSFREQWFSWLYINDCATKFSDFLCYSLIVYNYLFYILKFEFENIFLFFMNLYSNFYE
jgi:hypothetical protein